MSPRRRGASALLALALVGGALGAAVASTGGADPTAPVSAETASGPGAVSGAVSGAGATEPLLAVPATMRGAAAASALSSAFPSALVPDPAAPPAASTQASDPSPSSSPSTPTAAPGAAREGFAPSVALQPSADAGAPAPASARAAVSVAVPRIGVDTPLVGLGIAADGSLQVPGRDQFDLAGWLTSSAVPGTPGPSVIAGHVDSTSGPAVFFRLHELVPGDEVDVTLDDGSTAVFVVDAVERVSKDRFPSAEVYGPQPGPVLRLITCGGAFDHATGHYEDNVIAFASLR